MTQVIDLAGVSKLYGQSYALRDVSLAIGTGVTGLLGPNGSGKSTLIKSLLGLVRVQTGKISVMGRRMPHDMAAIKDLVGYLPEDDCYFAGLTGIESVRFMAKLSGLSRQEGLRRSHEILDYADIGQERYRTVETYSTGMRQKIKFAQAMVHDPQLIIMDEPTNGLDPSQRASMLKRIVSLSRDFGKSILVSTHILRDVQETCDNVVILARGEVRLVESLDRLAKPSRAGMQLVVWDNSNELIRQLAHLSLHAELQPDGTIWVHDIEPHQCDLIWSSARRANVLIKGLRTATHSLEQVFMDTVKESMRASA